MHQEEAARLKPGTIKHCALTVLKDKGPTGLPINDIMAAIADAGLRSWDPNSKRIVQFVRFCSLIWYSQAKALGQAANLICGMSAGSQFVPLCTMSFSLIIC